MKQLRLVDPKVEGSNPFAVWQMDYAVADA